MRTEITVYDTLAYSMADFRIAVRNIIWVDGNMIQLPTAEVEITLDGIDSLIAQLAIAKELLGEDFIVHNNGGMHVDGEMYDSIEDYRGGKISE
jgi:hypothetical protein